MSIQQQHLYVWESVAPEVVVVDDTVEYWKVTAMKIEVKRVVIQTPSTVEQRKNSRSTRRSLP